MTFIAVEGIDGAGKSVLTAGLIAHLERRGKNPLLLREPGSTPLGERVRAVLLDPAVGAVEPLAEALLFAACRAQMVATHIRPALARGRVVVVDRFHDSTLAYQGGGSGVPRAVLDDLGRHITGDLWPDLVLILDVDPAVAATRRARGLDRMEARDAAFHARVRQMFLTLAAEDPRRRRVLDAGRPAAAVVAEATALVDHLLASKP